MDENYKYVTLLSTDDYILGTLCLAQSLRKVRSKYSLLVLCSQNISERVISVLNQEKLDYSILKDTLNIDANTNPEYKRWNYTFDKLAVFNLTQYSKIISLDSDMYVVKNIDHLFEDIYHILLVAHYLFHFLLQLLNFFQEYHNVAQNIMVLIFPLIHTFPNIPHLKIICNVSSMK